MIPASLRAFLEGLIDYAGLFPPAGLPMTEAFENYLRYRRSSDSWMLARYIVPASRLGELPSGEGAREEKALPLSVILGGGSERESFQESCRRELREVSDFLERGERAMTATAFEMKLPENDGDVEGAIRGVREMLDAGRFESAGLFVEAPVDEGLPEIVAALGEVERVGFKLRCGGLSAELFPNVEQVATTIGLCAARGVPIKYTAGLHHPMRHHDREIGVMMHGFLNVFAASLLARRNQLKRDELIPLLECEDIGALSFDEDGLEFGGHRVSAGEVESLRKSFAVSYGSCSFDEPREDLREAGLLPR